MNCPICKAPNDEDALFCTMCGKPLDYVQRKSASRQRRVYLITLLFVPVFILAGAIGYYKFYLPNGVAAVVNGEEIKMSELEAAVARLRKSGDAANDLRYRALDELISERLVLQEARKAGIAVSKDAIGKAAVEAQAASGLTEESFKQAVSARYGSMRGFESELERRIMINRLIAERVVPPGTDQKTAGPVVNRWLQNLSAHAAVRIALAEQLAGPGCGCCSNRNEAGVKNGMRGCPVSGAGTVQAPDQKQAAVSAALRYWHEKHGPDGVTAQATDYGCHVQVDIIQDKETISSLRYQGGRIIE